MTNYRNRLSVLFLMILLIMLMRGSADAHPVVIDGDPGDWLIRAVATANQGLIARDALLRGEYIWRDASGDERADFQTPDTNADLLEFRVTSDISGLYFMAIFTDITLNSGDGTVQLQVAIDMDQVAFSGETSLGASAETSVSANAAWEYLLMTRFGSGGATPSVYDAAWADLAGPGLAVSQLSTVNDCAEIFVSWDLLDGIPSQPIRFTVAVTRSDVTDEAWDIVGGSDVLEAVTLYADPGSILNTAAEIADAVVDYHFDIWFDLDPQLEPMPPIIISEILYDAIVAEPAHEWFEIQNLSGQDLSLEGYRIGDEETPGQLEGMRAFPTGSVMTSAQTVLIANNATEFHSIWSVDADYEIVDSAALVPDLVIESGWTSGVINLHNSGDELLLLDPHWTIIDVVTWESASYPGITAALGAIGGRSISRVTHMDTDDCSNDFIVLTLPNPGEFGYYSGINAPVRPVSSVSASPNPFNPFTVISFELERAMAVDLAIYSLDGRRIRSLIDGRLGRGIHESRWDGRASNGRRVASGTYFLKLLTEEGSRTQKLTLAK